MQPLPPIQLAQVLTTVSPFRSHEYTSSQLCVLQLSGREDLWARGTGEAITVDLDMRDRGRIRARELVRGGGLLVEECLNGKPVNNGIPLEEQELGAMRLKEVAAEAPNPNLAALAYKDAVSLVIDHEIGIGRHPI